MTPPDYEYLRKYLKDHSGLDLSADKQYLIESRLLPLARRAGLSGISDLVQKMKGGSAPFNTLGSSRAAWYSSSTWRKRSGFIALQLGPNYSSKRSFPWYLFSKESRSCCLDRWKLPVY